MSRQHFNRPWLHTANGYFGTTTGRKRVYLDKDYRVACRKLRDCAALKSRRSWR